MKKIRFLFISLFLGMFACSGAFASGLTLEKICGELAAHPNTKGDFVQTKTISSSNRSLKSSGTFIFSLDGIMWETKKPFPSSLVVGKSFVIQTGADGKKTVIDASDNQIFGSIANTLVSVFSNDVETLNESFYTDFSDKGNGNWELNLLPKDSTISSVLKTLKLEGTSINNKTTLNTIVMTESSDNSITYAFSNQEYPKELTADEKANFTVR